MLEEVERTSNGPGRAKNDSTRTEDDSRRAWTTAIRRKTEFKKQ